MHRALRLVLPAIAGILTAGGCSVIIEQQIAELPEHLDGGPLPGVICQTVQDCLEIEEQANNCQQVCLPGADGRGHCSQGINTPDGVFCGDTAAEDEVCVRGTCTPRTCGDGFADRANGEYCDDGNTEDADLCANDCTARCNPPAPPGCDDLDILVDGVRVDLHLDACTGGAGVCDTGADACHPMTTLPDGTSCTLLAPPGDAGVSDGGALDAGTGTPGRCQTGRCIPFIP